MFCGPNNAGKSNLLRALSLLFGQKWPPNTLSIDDKHRSNRTSSILIEAHLDAPLTKNYYGTAYDVWGLRLKYDAPDQSSFVCLDQSGAVLQTRNGRDLFVDNDTRRQLTALHVEAVRDLSDELRAGQWSFLGRILAAVCEQLTADSVFSGEHATRARGLSDHLRTGAVSTLQQTLNEEMRGITGFSTLSLTFEPPGIMESLKALRINVSEVAGLPECPAQELGQGLQSALVIAIVRAYQRISGSNPILVIEEPESYLHPQGRRSFFSILRALADAGRCQVLCTTHSTEFVDLSISDHLYVVRKEAVKGTVVTRGDPSRLSAPQKAELKLATEFNPGLREAIFSRCAVLCEGPTEEGAIPELIRKAGRDPDSEGFSIRSVEGKDSLPFMIEVLRSLGIPVIAVYDTDRAAGGVVPPAHVLLNSEIETAAGGPDRCWPADPNFEVAYSVPSVDRSKARSALLWARSLNEIDAGRIVSPLLTKIDASL